MPRLSQRFGPDKGEFSARVRAERERLGLTQERAAERLGVNRSAYKTIEGTANPQLSTLIALKDVLGMDPKAIAPELFAG